MAQTIKLRRSAVAGNRPTTAQLDLGELAINTVDGKIYFEKSGSNGESIQEIFTTNATNSGSLTTIGDLTITGSLNVSGSTTQIGSNNLFGNTVLSGSLIVSGSIGMNASLVSIQGPLRLDPSTDPGAQNITASFLFTSASNTSTGYDLYYRQSDNIVKFKWLEGGISTGLLYGGVITYSGTTINVSKGSAIVNSLNASTSSEVGPIFKYVQWGDYSEPAEYLETEQNTFIYVDDSGVIHQQPNYFTSTQYSHSIPLGRVTHANYTTITGAGSNVQTTYDSDQQQNAFIRAFGPIKINGLTLAPHASGMRISIGGGETFNLGGFYPQDPNHPSSYVSNSFPTASIARAYRSGSTTILDNNGGSFYTTIDSTKWDDGTGTLNSMGGSDWQIQRVFVNPVSGRTVVYYGQHGTYTTLLNALQYLATDPFVEGEFTAKSLVFVGYIVLRGNTSNLADTNNNVFIQAGTFRNTAGSSGGSSIISLTLDGISDVNTSNPTDGQALVYNSGVWENGTPISASHAGYVDYINIGNKPSLVSGSSQLTSSYDLRYTLSGSITQTTWDNISGKPDGILSSSSQLTESFDLRYALSGSLGSGGGVSAIYIANQGVLQGTASYFDFNGSGVYATINDNTASIQITGGGGGGGVYNSYFAELSQSSAASTWSFFHDLGVEHPVVTIYDESNQVIQPLSIEALTTSSMEIIFSSARKGYAVATIGSALPYVSASYEGYTLQIVDGAPMWAVSSSNVETASYVEYSNVANKPSLVSGSSQLTSSYDERYVLVGSITQTTWDNIENKPGGIISSSAQLPAGLVSGSSQIDITSTTNYTTFSSSIATSISSSNASVITLSASVSTINNTQNSRLGALETISASSIARLNSLELKTGSLATTGSNTFTGTQTISASLLVSGTTNFNSAVAINDANVNLTNTASLNLTSGSSIYVANNGVIALTGSLLVTGSASITGSITATTFNGTINANNGVVSGSSQILAGSGIVSSSSQLTASYDERYILNGSITQTTWDNIENKPGGIISSSAQLPSGIISASSQLEGTTFNNLTIRNLYTLYETSSVIYASGSNQFGDELTDVQILSGSVEVVGQLSLNGVSVITQIPSGTISSSAQLPSGIISSSAQFPEGVVSGSTQIILQNTTGQLSASRVDGLNLSQIATGSWTASVANDEFNIIHEGSNILSLNSGSTTFDNGLVTIIANSFANDYAEGYSEFGDGLLIQGNEIISGALSVRGDIVNYGTTTISGSLIVSGTLNLENANIDNSRYLHVQSTGATTWTVNHNLEYDYPNVTIWDATGNVIIPDSIVRVSNNQLTVGFISNESGWAHVSVGGISTGQADRFLYTQATEETTWTINHGLNYKYVNVNVYDDNDEMLLPQTVTATNANTTTLVFAIPTAGNAIISKGGARTTSAFIEFGNGVYGLSGSLNLTGSIVVSGDVDAQNFNTTSDVRLKTNLEVITGALDKVEQLNAYTYDWIEEYNNEGVRQIGLVSQEVQKVQPELVHEKEVVVGNVTERMLLLDYSKVTTLLIGAVKELSEKVKQLENKIGE